MMNNDQLEKMNLLMYVLTKEAARYSFTEFMEELNITDDDYAAIKEEWKKIGITNAYL